MAKIVVTLHGQILSELNLEPGQEYFAGRSAQCQILLENERGISRQHVRFYQENNIWHAELMSKFGGLVFEGENVYNITLQGEMRFSVPPYEFCYNEDIQVEQTQDDSADKSPELDVSEESLSGNLDATAVGVTTLVAYLKINNTQLRTSEILKLEGNMWTLGRHPSCEIIINDSAVSRKHFDLTKTSEGYFISDHGSSNSTKINGDKIPPNTPHRINSGDVIAIRHIEIIFEIHDIAYEKQLSAVPEFSKSVIYESDKINHDNNPFENSIINSPAQLSNSEAQPGEVLRIPPPNKFKSFKPNPIQIIIGILFVVLIFGLFYKNETGEKSAASNKPPEMSESQKKQVLDSFNLAQNYYVERKYVLCLSQIEKLHTSVPFYSNSKEIESLCKQALELQQIEADRRRKNEARAAVNNKINSNVETCKALINPKMTTAEITACLQPSLELDPQNGAVIELLSQVQIYEEQARADLQRKEDYANRRNEGLKVYSSAMRHERSNKLKLAIKEYKRFLGGNYPGLSQEEASASRSIASISETLEAQLQAEVAKCEAAMTQSDLKAAVISCDQVLKNNPQSKEAREIRNRAFSQLQKEMKSLYEDSRLEESLGNIEAAKEKWNKILEKSVPNDSYYKKVKKSLKKYGIGM